MEVNMPQAAKTENKNQRQLPGHPEGCRCMGCDDCGYGRRGHFGLRLLIGIIILMAVFLIGFKVGEFRRTVRGYYPQRFQRQVFPMRSMRTYPYGTFPGMMYPSASSTPAMPQPNSNIQTK